MKAPVIPNYFQDHQGRNSESEGWITQEKLDTPGLHKLIASVSFKRRQIRRRLKCSNLFVEAVLSNTIRKAERDLALKQEIKRRNLQKFQDQLKLGLCSNVSSSYNSNHSFYNESNDNEKEDDWDEELKECLANIDQFFDDLKQVKA